MQGVRILFIVDDLQLEKYSNILFIQVKLA